jgi:hypothetical protein
MHSQVSREQSQVDQTPFDPALPIFTQRPNLRTGQPGDRTFVQSTEFIRASTRERIIVSAQKSKRYLQASVRSIVDFSKYAWNTAFEAVVNKVAKRNPKWTIEKVIDEVIKKHGREVEKKSTAIDDNIKDEARDRGRVIDTSIPFSLYTQYENISPSHTDPRRAARNIESKLRQKHEPATGEKGTLLADQFLFQLIHQRPANAQTSIPKSARNRKGTRGRGNK